LDIPPALPFCVFKLTPSIRSCGCAELTGFLPWLIEPPSSVCLPEPSRFGICLSMEQLLYSPAFPLSPPLSSTTNAVCPPLDPHLTWFDWFLCHVPAFLSACFNVNRTILYIPLSPIFVLTPTPQFLEAVRFSSFCPKPCEPLRCLFRFV